MTDENFIRSLDRVFKLVVGLFVFLVILLMLFVGMVTGMVKNDNAMLSNEASHTDDILWKAPDFSAIPLDSLGDVVRYGRELIMHTATYLGPLGKVNAISNGMNCTNCHLDGGTRPFGNNYALVASTYPKHRERSGTIEGFEKRVNECIQRSLNGKPLDENSREMKAIITYMKWVGKDVSKHENPKGTGLIKLPLLDRPADPVKGKEVYLKLCSSCHTSTGEGMRNTNGVEWKYPPLWGVHSYNSGAGLYRISKFAAFIKSNMPYGVTYDRPVLKDDEAWDIAAYVNSLARPQKDLSGDWPDIEKKPIDHPFGPYADSFSENDHKYGPFEKIYKAHQALK